MNFKAGSCTFRGKYHGIFVKWDRFGTKSVAFENDVFIDKYALK